MRTIGRIASILAVLAASAALIAAPASAEVKPSIGSGGVVYGFTSKPAAASQAPSLRAATYLQHVYLYRDTNQGGGGMGYKQDQPDLKDFNDQASSLKNIGTGYAICFYWNSNYWGKWIRLAENTSMNVPDWLNDQISSLRARQHSESC